MIDKRLLNRIGLIAIAFSLGMPASAQHRLPPVSDMQTRMEEAFKERFTMRNGRLAPIPLTQTAVKKPTATKARLITMYSEKSDGTGYIGVDDSTHFYWSGTRGSEFDYARMLVNITYPLMLNEMEVNSETEYFAKVYETMNFDSAGYYRWDAATASFSTPSRKAHSTLIGDNLIDNQITWGWNSGVWERTTRNIFSWNSDRNLTSLVTESWDGVLWEGDHKTDIDYTTEKKMAEFVSATYNVAASAWENSNRSAFSYSGNDLATLLDQTWSKPDNAWENDRQQVYGYDNGVRTTKTQRRWNKTAGAWVAESRSVFSYGPDGKLAQELWQSWDDVSNSWETDARTIYEYDADSVLASVTWDTWDGATWTPDEKFIRVQNTSGGLRNVSLVRQNWDAIASSWNNHTRVTLLFNEHDRITSLAYQTWDPAGFWDAANGDLKFQFLYETFEDGSGNDDEDPGNVDVVSAATGFRYYPNPSSSLLTIETDNRNITQIRLTDLTGRTVQQWQPGSMTQHVQLSTTQLVPGVYFLHVTHDGVTETVSLQVQR